MVEVDNQNNMNDKKSKPPKLYLILKIIGTILILAGIALIIVSLAIKGENIEATRMGYRFGGICGIIIGGFLLYAGFLPLLQKNMIKTQKHIIETNKSDLKDISSDAGDIASQSAKKMATAVKEGLEDKKYCKYCGEAIDSDSIFCPYCGKQQ